MTRPHLVQITFQPPHRRGGGSARQFSLLRALADHFDVTVIVPEDPGTPPDELAALGSFAEPIVLPVPTWSRHPVRRAVRLAQMVASPRPYASTAMDPLRGPMRDALTRLARAPDAVYVEPSNIADWIALAPAGVPTILGFHDLTFAAFHERARRARGVTTRIFDEVEWRKMRRTELRAAARADLNVMISPVEEAELRRLVPSARTVVAPHGVDTDYFRPRGRPPAAGPLLFLGSLNHPPNIDGASRMARDVLPAVRVRHPDVRLELVGRSPTDEIRDLASLPGVDLIGEVADVRPHLAKASVVCAPIMFGGGVRVKLLDALAMGCAIVTTPKGAEGLELRDGDQLRIAPMDRFVAAVDETLSDPDGAATMGIAGRAFVTRDHAWDASARKFAAAAAPLFAGRASRKVDA